MVKDPVCGMEVEPRQAAARREYRGQTFFFCSEDDASKFDAEPARYAPAIPSATTGVGADAPPRVRITLSVSPTSSSGGPALVQSLKALPGVSRARVNVRGGRVAVDYDPSQVTTADLVEAIRAAGFGVGGQTARLKVSGLYCAECVARIEDSLKTVPGVLDATMNAATNVVKVEYAPASADLERLARAVESAGPYQAQRAAEASASELDKEAQATEKEYRSLMRKWWFAAAVGVPTMILSYPWLFPGLRDLFPRGSDNLLYV